MKITKKRLKEIIKEEVSRTQLREGEQKWEMLDKLIQNLGPEQALQEIVKAMSDYEAISNLQHVLDMHDITDDSFSDDDEFDSQALSDREEREWASKPPGSHFQENKKKRGNK